MTYDLSVLTNEKTKIQKIAAVQYVRRLGNHHFAHLRAVAEGLTCKTVQSDTWALNTATKPAPRTCKPSRASAPLPGAPGRALGV